MPEDRAQPWDSLAIDMNGDGRLTIEDVWQWLLELVFLPGDAALALLLSHAPALAEFFELGSDDYSGPLSVFASMAFWLLLLVAAGLVLNAIRNLDRAVTSYLSGRYAELCRRLRVLRRRVVSWIGMMRQRRQTKKVDIDVAAVELEKLETAVLRCHANVDDFRVLTADEIAATLRLPVRPVRSALRRLAELCLVERSFGTDEGLEGHRITQAGQIYLIDQ